MGHHNDHTGLGLITFGAVLEHLGAPWSLSGTCLAIGTVCSVLVCYTRVEEWWYRRKERKRGRD